LIDLHRGDIVKEFFSLPYDFIAPDVLIADELQIPAGDYLLSLGLISNEMSGDQVSVVHKILEHNQAIGYKDIFALVLASDLGLILLTGDRRLRQLSDKHRVVVHGTLWVLNEMVKLCVVTNNQACDALRLMLTKGSRLPNSDCERLLSIWGSK